MADIHTFVAQTRDKGAKGAARAVRRSGRVPAVIYGNKQDPELISLDGRDILRALHRGAFTSKLVDIDVGGKKTRVLPRDVQLDPVKDRPVHVDFLRIVGASRIRLMVPVVFTDDLKSPGLKKGGVLNVVRHEIEFQCRADSIPEKIIISLDGREIGDSIHISAVNLPDGITPVISNRDFTIATIAPPTTQEVDVKPTAAEGAAATAASPASGAAAPAAGDAKAAAPAAGAAKAAPAAKPTAKK